MGSPNKDLNGFDRYPDVSSQRCGTWSEISADPKPGTWFEKEVMENHEKMNTIG